MTESLDNVLKKFKDLKKIKIVSDGSSIGTEIYSSDGEQIGFVQDVEIKVSVDQLPKAVLTVLLPELDLDNVELEEVYALGPKGHLIPLKENK